MVGVAQLVEHWLVVPVAAGSSPVVHPMCEVGPRYAVRPLLFRRQFAQVGPFAHVRQHSGHSL
jgi:hypothetical protein